MAYKPTGKPWGGRTRTSGQGRPKGVPNKNNHTIRNMIVMALEAEGGVKYLRKAAREQPAAFLALIGRVLPLNLSGSEGGPLVIRWETPTDDAVVIENEEPRPVLTLIGGSDG